MQKNIVYVASILAIVVVLCSIASSSYSKVTDSKYMTTQTIKNIEIEDVQVTTNIWDYVHEQQSKREGIGDSESVSQSEEETEPQLTIIVR